MKGTSRIICIFTVIIITILFTGSAFAEYSSVVTFGADLTKAQRTMLASEFGINLAKSDVPVLDVTNAEERRYLEGLVADQLIGNRAISSALVEMLPEGQGINVETRNITWVTTDMYENALVTAGVKDARIVVAAPFPVSGTAALTGIFKAVEHATGRSLGNNSKKIANEELVRTGQLGQEIGKEKATRLILLVKERVIRERPRTRVEIRQIIINVAGDLNINLTERQTEDIITLMQRVNGLKLNIGDISRQITDLRTEVEKNVKNSAEVKSWVRHLLDLMNTLIQQIRSLFVQEQ